MVQEVEKARRLCVAFVAVDRANIADVYYDQSRVEGEIWLRSGR